MEVDLLIWDLVLHSLSFSSYNHSYITTLLVSPSLSESP
jgi:hypothetical protein